MKKTILIILTLFISIPYLYAQDESASNKKMDNKPTKKEIRRREARENLMAYDSLVNSENWVLEANTLYNRYNEGYPVNSNLNFVSLKDSLLTIQFSFYNTLGANGVGGITLDGKVTRYDINYDPNKDKSIFIRCNVLTTVLGSSDVFINVYSNGRATAKISDNWGNRYTFDGYIVPYYQSRVYKGMRSF